MLDFMDTGSGGHFRQRRMRAFPGMTIGSGLSNYRLAGHGNDHGHIGPGRILHVRRQLRRRVQPDDRRQPTRLAPTSLTNATNSSGSTMAIRRPAGCSRHPGHHVPGRGRLSGQPGVFPGRGRGEHGVLCRQGEQFPGATSFDANSILVGATTATTAGGGTSTTTTPLRSRARHSRNNNVSPIAASMARRTSTRP